MFKYRYHTTLAAFLIIAFTSFAANAQTMLAANTYRDSPAISQPLPGTMVRLKGRAEKLRLLSFLKGLNIPDVPVNEESDQGWVQLANTFTKLRLYPLAMKCFLKTLTPDSVTRDVPITQADQQLIADQLHKIGYEGRPEKSNIIKTDQILETFHDDKPSLAYAMVLHVKQPVRGTPKVHKFINTGHTFITLIKFNTDSSYAALTFGFGPGKNNLLAGTPLMPSAPPKFMDDGGHAWDEVIGKFISKHRFKKILELARQYEGLSYNLSTNNCTDFGLRAAQLAGLQVRDTRGSWPLGKGNSPGVAGESILLGKFNNSDTGNFDRLYIDTLSNTNSASARQ